MLPTSFHQDFLPAWRPGSVRVTDSAFLPRTCTGPPYQCPECRVFTGMGDETLAFSTLGIGEPCCDRLKGSLLL